MKKNVTFATWIFLLSHLLLNLWACSSEAQFGGSTEQDRRSVKNTQDAVKQGEQVSPQKLPASSLRRIEKTFKVSEVMHGETHFIAESLGVSKELVLRSQMDAQMLNFVQVSRPKVTRLFQQGHGGTARTQTFHQQNLGVLDLLIVIDNSRSMTEEQENLAARLDPLMQFVNESDWHINVVTTDPSQGCSRAVIRRGDPNVEAAFRSAIMAGNNGDGNEQGVRMAVEGLSCAQANWMRPNSAIAVLFVSDEDNCSDQGSGCRAPYNNPNYLIEHLSKNLGKNPGKDARIYGLIWQPNTQCRGASTVGVQYHQLITMTNGKSGSICDSDYAPTLRSISSDVATILYSDFELMNVPDPGSLKITVNGKIQVDGYTLQGKTLRFDRKPDYGATIEVGYTSGATPVLNRFPLGQSPGYGTLEVFLNDKKIDNSLYIYDSYTNEVVFNNPPIDDAVIRFEFRADLPLNSRFPLVGKVVPDSVVVQVNGHPTSEFDLTSDSQIVFRSIPADGASINIRYSSAGSPILSYDLATKDEDMSHLTVKDAETGEFVRANVKQGHLIIEPDEFRENRHIIVEFEDSELGHLRTKLPSLWIPGTLKVVVDEGQCIHRVINEEVDLSCDVPEGTGVHVSWDYRTETRNKFEFNEVLDPNQGIWTVLVDGIATRSYDRQGANIFVHDRLFPDSIVTITFEGPG